MFQYTRYLSIEGQVTNKLRFEVDRFNDYLCHKSFRIGSSNLGQEAEQKQSTLYIVEAENVKYIYSTATIVQ